MLFALICTDQPDGLDLRMATRPEHVACLNDLNGRGVLNTAGLFAQVDIRAYNWSFNNPGA